MDSRLAQIIAASIGPDGKPDRAKVYEALSITPDAPEFFLIDAVLAVEEANDKGRGQLRAEMEKGSQALANEAVRVETALGDLRTLIEADAKSRQRWLAFAIAIPSVVTAIAFVLIYYLVKRAG